MKTNRRCLMSLLILASSTTLRAAVIVDDAVLGSGGMFGDYGLTLTASIPMGQGMFAVYFDYAGGNIYDFNTADNNYSIAERLTLHQVPYGTIFTPEYVTSATPLFDNASPANWQISIPLDSSIYLAYWDDRMSFDSTPTANDSYGWIQLTHTVSGLEGSASVTALGNGIIVGTATQIPEPSTTALFIIGCLSLLRRSKK